MHEIEVYFARVNPKGPTLQKLLTFKKKKKKLNYLFSINCFLGWWICENLIGFDHFLSLGPIVSLKGQAQNSTLPSPLKSSTVFFFFFPFLTNNNRMKP